MDFSLDHLDMVTSDNSTFLSPAASPSTSHSMSNSTSSSTTSTHRDSSSSSQVLEELYKQIEDLQDKAKLNHRKLLLYEAENQKLIQEKNRLFFECKSTQEKYDLNLQAKEKLESYTEQIESDLRLKSEKLEAFDKLSQSQAIDLKRLSKFHLKISQVIKPYIQNLKDRLTDLELEKNKTAQHASALNQLNVEHLKKIDTLNSNLEKQTQSYNMEKNEFIRAYEEQIHFLSKEIVAHQEKTQSFEAEIFRLKKQSETKHFIENELVRFKRDQEMHLQQLQDLKLKNINLEIKIEALLLEKSQLATEKNDQAIENHRLTECLEVTRQQLTHKLDSIEKLNLRLKMLEKLNTHLSQNMQEPTP